MEVDLTVAGPDGAALLQALGVAPEDIKVSEPANGPRTFQAKVHPFAVMAQEVYADWVANLMRQKLSEHWSYRW